MARSGGRGSTAQAQVEGGALPLPGATRGTERTRGMRAALAGRAYSLAAGSVAAARGGPPAAGPQAATRRAGVAGMAASGGRAVDAAVHLWAPMDGKPPGDAQTLLQRMDAAGVAHAVVVQPGVIADPFDHSYVADAVAAHPDRLTGVLLADPRPGGGGARALRELVSERGFRGVRCVCASRSDAGAFPDPRPHPCSPVPPVADERGRGMAARGLAVRSRSFNPGLDPAGDMTGAVWKEMYAAAGELSAPVGHMTFNSLPQHAGAIRALAEEFPQTVAIVDHMGFCRSDDEWDVLLSFADLPQVRVKLSAFFRCGAGSAPGGLAERIRQLVDAFGTERLLWGSDWPWVDAEDGGYEGACDMLRAHGGLSESEVEQIMSATPRDLYNLGA